MRGRRLGKTGGVFAGIHRGFFRAEYDADGRGSFAAVERSMSDRLLECPYMGTSPFLPISCCQKRGFSRHRLCPVLCCRHR
jgi:hypothetical protein